RFTCRERSVHVTSGRRLSCVTSFTHSRSSPWASCRSRWWWSSSHVRKQVAASGVAACVQGRRQATAAKCERAHFPEKSREIHARRASFFRYIWRPMHTTTLREVIVAPDKFEVVADDA